MYFFKQLIGEFPILHLFAALTFMDSLYRNKFRTGSARCRGYDYTSPGRYFITICTRNRIPYFGKIENGKMILSASGVIAERYWREIPKHFPFVDLDVFIIMPDHMHGIIIINRRPPSTKNPGKLISGFDGAIGVNGAGNVGGAVNVDGTVGFDGTGVVDGTGMVDVDGMVDGTGVVDVDGMVDGTGVVDVETPNLGVSTGNSNEPSQFPVSYIPSTPVILPVMGVTNTIPAPHADSKNQYWKSQSVGSIINQYKRICTIKIRSEGYDFEWQARFYDRIIRAGKEYSAIRKYIIMNPMKWNRQ